MAYLDGQTQKSYYDKESFGSYQFVSLEDVVSQFMVAYVGDEKNIRKVSRTDVAFHAQRGLAELTFDTFKSFKSQSISLPPTLVMPLPHDYVNYTRLSWCDASGIKHPLYRTNDTSNPFEIKQDEDGLYDFPFQQEVFSNSNFTNGLNGWTKSPQVVLAPGVGGVQTSIKVDESASNPVVTFKTNASGGPSNGGSSYGYATYIYQEIDASGFDYVSFKATATTTAASSITITQAEAEAAINYAIDPVLGETRNIAGTFNKPGSTVRVGLSTQPPSDDISMQNYVFNGVQYYTPTTNSNPSYFDLGYIEWAQGETGEKTYVGESLNLSAVSGPVYLVAISIIDHVDIDTVNYSSSLLFDTATVDDIAIYKLGATKTLTEVEKGISSTWKKFKSISPAELENDSYANNDYQRVPDEKYGIDPAHAQTNGSFYIDDRIGRIHFSSNVSGRTVILDYISDSLGTDAEMQVHKFAEEAIYRYINYAILSTKSNVAEYVIRRAKKEKFAAVRQAKLRLSSIKLEDITQTLRGKSKQIKH